MQKPGRRKRAAGTRRAVLRWWNSRARPHPEERACRRRSANSNARARVSKDEDEPPSAPSCFETHRSALRLGKQLRSGRAARLLSMRAIRTNLRVCEIIASVSALLFTGKIATRACPPHRGGKIASADRGGDAHARLSGLRASRSPQGCRGGARARSGRRRPAARRCRAPRSLRACAAPASRRP